MECVHTVLVLRQTVINLQEKVDRVSIDYIFLIGTIALQMLKMNATLISNSEIYINAQKPYRCLAYLQCMEEPCHGRKDGCFHRAASSNDK